MFIPIGSYYRYVENKKGKRIVIKGKFVFNIEEFLEIIENA